MIALAIAGLALAATATVGLITFALRALGSERRAGELSRALAVAEAALQIEASNHEKEKRRADFEEERADDLDDAMAEHAADLDPAGARGRLLARWRTLRTPAVRSDESTVPAPPAATTPVGDRDDGLLAPGE